MRRSVSSGWVRQEYSALMRRSIEAGRRFIPVIIGDVELPEFAATRLAVGFRELGADDYGPVIARIAAGKPLRAGAPRARTAQGRTLVQQGRL
jgi:hypothetical protein